MLKLEKLKTSEIENFIELAKLATRDNEKGRKKLIEDIEIRFGLNNIEIGEFFVLKLNDKIIGTALLIARQNDLSGIDIFNVSIKSDFKGKGYGKKFMNILFGKIKAYKKEYAFISTSGKIGEFYKKCGMKYYGNILREKTNNRVYLYKKLI